MKIKKTLIAFAASALLAFGSAHAATFSLTGLQGGPLVNPGSFTATLNSAVADPMASLSFVLNGFLSLDGHNDYKDLLTLTINGNQVGTGSFNLGGGGASDTMFGNGTAVTVNPSNMDPGTAIGWNGGTTTVSGVTFALNSGVNTFTFAYSIPGASNGSGQGLGDEGWGIASATVTAVPEPETYAMLLAGLGLMGAIARRRKQSDAV